MKNLFLIAFFIVLFIGIILTALTNMGGNDEMMQDIAKEYVQHIVPGKANIETLHDIQYFPQALVNVEGVSVAREGNKEPVFTIGSAQVAMDFLDITFSTGKLAVLNIKQLYAQAGIFTQKELYLERFGIRDERVDDAPYLYADGKYGGRTFTARADMERFGKSGDHRYRFEASIPVALQSEGLNIKASLERKSGRKMIFHELVIQHGTNEMRGQVVLQSSADLGTIYIDGALDDLIPSLVFSFETEDAPAKISGAIKSKELDRRDVETILALMHEVQSILGLQKTQNATQIDWGDTEMDITVNSEAYQHKTGEITPLTTTLSLQNGKLDLGGLE